MNIGDVVYQRDTVKMMESAMMILSVKIDVLNGFHQMLSAAPNHNVSQMRIVLLTYIV